MPSVTGLGLTFNVPNYTGEVLQVTPSDTPFLSAIGGLNEQGEVVTSTEFEGQTQDLGTPSQPGILEGADAPTLTNRTRANWSNVAQIFQYAYGVSYTRQAAVQQLAGIATAGQANPVTDEIAYQDMLHLTDAARDINWTFINGTYNKPTDNTTARKTRGLLAAITTNALDNREAAIAATIEADDETFTAAAHGLANGDQVVLSSLVGGTGLTAGTVYYVVGAATNTFRVSVSRGGSAVAVSADGTADVRRLTALTRVRTLDLIQLAYDSHGISAGAEPTLMCNSTIKRALTKLFITDANYRETSRNVGGVMLTQLETDFGTLNIMLERAMPRYTLAFAHLGLIKPAYLLIPGKGYLFTEDLAKTGASTKRQIYGEVGLWHGPQQAHAKIEYVGEIATA